MITKREILKSTMNAPYCGETRFDFLDDEERPLIYEAMQRFSDIENKELIDEKNWYFSQAGDMANQKEDLKELFEDCQKKNSALSQRVNELENALAKTQSIQDGSNLNASPLDMLVMVNEIILKALNK